jgi:hypothetical protein
MAMVGHEKRACDSIPRSPESMMDHKLDPYSRNVTEFDPGSLLQTLHITDQI